MHFIICHAHNPQDDRHYGCEIHRNCALGNPPQNFPVEAPKAKQKLAISCSYQITGCSAMAWPSPENIWTLLLTGNTRERATKMAACAVMLRTIPGVALSRENENDLACYFTKMAGSAPHMDATIA